MTGKPRMEGQAMRCCVYVLGHITDGVCSELVWCRLLQHDQCPVSPLQSTTGHAYSACISTLLT